MFDTEEAIDALCEAVGTDERPVWTVFDRDDGEPDGFVLMPGPGAMLGWRAPSEVWAIGVVAGGTATVVGDKGVDDRRCQVACVVDRWGTVSGRLRLPDPSSSGSPDLRSEAPRDGRVLDILRRCLGLPTSPAQESMPGVVSLAWLAALATEARRRRRPLGWLDAVDRHPVVSLLDLPAKPTAHGGPETARHPGDPWVSLIDAALRSWDWGELRRRCVERGTTIAGITPDTASWMDDGMFSRWLAEGVDAVDALLDAGFRAVNEDDHPALNRLLVAAIDRHEDEYPPPPPSLHCRHPKALHRR